MALVSVKHYEGMGDHYLQRVVGFRPNDPDAVEYAAERLAEHIGEVRGGDGYGYPLDYGEGPGWTVIGAHWVDRGRYVVTQDWRPMRPTAPMVSDGVFTFGDVTYTRVIDANGRRWTYTPARAGMSGYWTCEESDDDPECWVVGLADGGDPYDRALIARHRWDANNPGSSFGRNRGNPEVV